MEKIISAILIVLLVLTLSGCCKTFCKVDPIIEIKEVYIPTYSCPAPIDLVRPKILDVTFSSPLFEKDIIGLDETNYKNIYINDSNLLFYVTELERIIKVYKDEQINVGKPIKKEVK